MEGEAVVEDNIIETPANEEEAAIPVEEKVVEEQPVIEPTNEEVPIETEPVIENIEETPAAIETIDRNPATAAE